MKKTVKLPAVNYEPPRIAPTWSDTSLVLCASVDCQQLPDIDYDEIDDYEF